MALIAAHLNAGVVLEMTVRCEVSSTTWDLGPRQYVLGGNSALNTFDQTKPSSLTRGAAISVPDDA